MSENLWHEENRRSWNLATQQHNSHKGDHVMVEFHPILGLLDGALSGDWSEANDCLGGAHYRFEEGVYDYVAESGSAQPFRRADHSGGRFRESISKP